MDNTPQSKHGRKANTVADPHVAPGDQVELDFGDHRSSVWHGPYVVAGIRAANDAPYRVVIEGLGACVPEVVRRMRAARR